MHQLLQQYLPIAVFFGISSVISLVIITLPRLLAYTKYNKAKLETYECGFAPFGDARSKFDVRFYLVAILFIIFDLEVSYLFPWAIYLNVIDLQGYWWMIAFLLLLTIGFIYEWRKGALNWD